MSRMQVKVFLRTSGWLAVLNYRRPLCLALRPRTCGMRRITTVICLALLALAVGCGAGNTSGNPQVATYTFKARTSGSVIVEFGTTKAYGFDTSAQTIPEGGGLVNILVAGMLPNTLYHMRAVAQYSDGTTETDPDRTFQSGSYAALNTANVPQIVTTTSPGQTPQGGLEMINEVETFAAPLIATNLSGQVVWAYIPSPAIVAPSLLQAPKLLPNGNIIFILGATGSVFLTNPSSIPSTALQAIQEINLAGVIVRQLTIAQLNQKLSAANYNLTLLSFHHDMTPLPNGHLLVLGNLLKSVVLAGQTTPTQVLGDVVIDLDTNWNPVWVWNEFDHLDVNRHPWNFPDWTHSNAIVYSKDDGNILVSIRHQNWIVKVDYNNGSGTGDVIWRLGEGGDFTLKGGVDPTDWFYAQHGPAFTTSNTTGIFGLTLMDNGNDRMYPNGPAGVTCGTNGSPACYSTIPIFQINESNMTATLTFHDILPPSLYNGFGGNAEVLENGDLEYDLCELNPNNPNDRSSQIFEITPTDDSQQVWNLEVSPVYAYRGYRIPSLYPGVQW